MRRDRRHVIVSTAIVILVGCAGDERACTAIGAPPTVTLNVAEVLAQRDMPMRVTVCVGSTCHTFPRRTGVRDGFVQVDEPTIKDDGQVTVRLVIETHSGEIVYREERHGAVGADATERAGVRPDQVRGGARGDRSGTGSGLSDPASRNRQQVDGGSQAIDAYDSVWTSNEARSAPSTRITWSWVDEPSTTASHEPSGDHTGAPRPSQLGYVQTSSDREPEPVVASIASSPDPATLTLDRPAGDHLGPIVCGQ